MILEVLNGLAGHPGVMLEMLNGLAGHPGVMLEMLDGLAGHPGVVPSHPGMILEVLDGLASHPGVTRPHPGVTAAHPGVCETMLILERLMDDWRIDMPLAPRKTEIAIAFGQVITRLRRERGSTILMLSERTGLNAKHLSVIEKGGNVPAIYTLFTLAEVFGKRVSEIVDEVEQRLAMK